MIDEAGWVDSHCHLQGDDDPTAVIERALAVGVSEMVCIGTDLESSAAAVALAAAHPEVWATVGLHPHDASRLDDQWGALSELAGADRVVGVGEAGFDFHYMHSPVEAQDAAFRAHIRLAHATGKTLVIHTRDAWDATFDVLRVEGAPARTVFHCFTGGPPEAEIALGFGAWLSFSGIITFGGANDVRAAATRAPADRLLVETDSPYLTPAPHRGRPNEPAHVVLVGRALAEARGEAPEVVAAATGAGARAAFALW